MGTNHIATGSAHSFSIDAQANGASISKQVWVQSLKLSLFKGEDYAGDEF
jgi:hypothetical protein